MLHIDSMSCTYTIYYYIILAIKYACLNFTLQIHIPCKRSFTLYNCRIEYYYQRYSNNTMGGGLSVLQRNGSQKARDLESTPKSIRKAENLRKSTLSQHRNSMVIPSPVVS